LARYSVLGGCYEVFGFGRDGLAAARWLRGFNGSAGTAGELCDEVCGWPDACFAELNVSVEDGQCIQTCVASVKEVGMPCLQAINDTVSCLGTCEFDALTDQQLLDCQGQAEAISANCD
jgi:hypothetical protein